MNNMMIKDKIKLLSNLDNNLENLSYLANAGDDEMMCILGWGYLSGKYFTKDLDKIFYWLERAIEHGNEKAKEFLEYCKFLKTLD